jgi:hypothetical protein
VIAELHGKCRDVRGNQSWRRIGDGNLKGEFVRQDFWRGSRDLGELSKLFFWQLLRI